MVVDNCLERSIKLLFTSEEWKISSLEIKICAFNAGKGPEKAFSLWVWFLNPQLVKEAVQGEINTCKLFQEFEL